MIEVLIELVKSKIFYLLGLLLYIFLQLNLMQFKIL